MADGIVAVDDKDFHNLITLHNQDGHCMCAERKTECPREKKTNWREFPGWTNDEDKEESTTRKRKVNGVGNKDGPAKLKGAEPR